MKRLLKLDPKSLEIGLEEFETGSSIGLAPFEEAGTTLIDEYEMSSPNLLDDFEDRLDVLSILDQDDGNPEESESEPGPEPVEEIDVEIEDVEEIGEADEVGMPPVENQEPLVIERPTLPQPLNPVIGFVCRHAAELPGIMDSHGRMIGRGVVNFIDLPCAGMVKPEWLKHALDKGASGAFVVACEPASCHHRRGACIVKGRFDGTGEPALSPEIDRRRVRFFFAETIERDQLLARIEQFLTDLAEINSGDEIQGREGSSESWDTWEK